MMPIIQIQYIILVLARQGKLAVDEDMQTIFFLFHMQVCHFFLLKHFPVPL